MMKPRGSNSFDFAEFISEQEVKYEFFGRIDETAKLPLARQAKKIRIILDHIVAINSIGVRTWCDWIMKFPQDAMITLEACPICFVRTFNSVSGALRSNMRVHSFVVPFFSEETDERIDQMILVQGVTSIEKSVAEVCPRDSRGQLMELDVLPNYFQFLERK